MEDVLAVYTRPYAPRRPQVCMDEQPVPLIGEARCRVPARPGHPERYDYEYVRNGVANIFLACEPLTGRRYLQITDRRTAMDWAHFIRTPVDQHYPDATQVVLVMDNLNTHTLGSLYEAFPAAEARRIARRVELHSTPAHGSWLDMAEIELRVLTRQCLNRRIPDRATLETAVAAWQSQRNAAGTPVTWRFTTADARIKLHRLYPSVVE